MRGQPRRQLLRFADVSYPLTQAAKFRQLAPQDDL